MQDLPEPVPAATLVLMREVAGGSPEILMMERPADMAFAAGALVFPGGRVDPGDVELGEAFDIADASARIAAIRETIEETGIAVGISAAREQSEALREGLATGRFFAELLDAQGLRPDLHALTPFARWCPNFRETRRFDTIFYLAQAPEGVEAGAPHPAEAVRIFWAGAAAILEQIEAGRAHAIFPTRRNLERLARFGSIAEARADAAAHDVRRITPWIEERGGRKWLCIPEDAGYPVTAELLETARRS